MRPIIRQCLIAVLVCGLGLPAVAAAQEGGISLDQAVKRIKDQRDVKVLSAETVTRDGERVHSIKVLTRDGRVKYVWVNAGG